LGLQVCERKDAEEKYEWYNSYLHESCNSEIIH